MICSIVESYYALNVTIDLGLHQGSHPRLGVVDHICFHPLASATLDQIAGTTKSVTAEVQSAASFCSTVKGTTVRIPCEVLKQQLQAGIFDNVEEAIIGTWQQDGLKGFFRGTGATLCREVKYGIADGEEEMKKNYAKNTTPEQNTGDKQVYPPPPYPKRLQKQKIDK
ncbi:hypothetical protein AgCh_006121 [Apium graveolens]